TTPHPTYLHYYSTPTPSSIYLFFFYLSGDHRDLHSFPTRRSSDLQVCNQLQKCLVSLAEIAWTGGVDQHCSYGFFICKTDHGNADRKSTRLNSSHLVISYAVFCLKKKKKKNEIINSMCNRQQC